MSRESFVASLALPKQNRLTVRKEIDHVFRRGRTVKGSSLFIRFIDNKKRFSRFTFVIPSKHVSLAVDRNKIKRIFYEKIMKYPSLLKQGQDIFITVFRKLSREEFKNLSDELGELLTRIR